MRVNAGKYRHRIIKMVNLETTRETSDKVRQAIFNMIGPFFTEGKALDLFAGSGSMGIEAISRGIDYVVFNDNNKIALQVLKENLDSLKINNQYKLLNLDYNACLHSLNGFKFDLIFLDPPYSMTDSYQLLEEILKADILNTEGLIIFEMKESTLSYITTSLKIIKEKKYGIKKVIIYQKG